MKRCWGQYSGVKGTANSGQPSFGTREGDHTLLAKTSAPLLSPFRSVERDGLQHFGAGRRSRHPGSFYHAAFPARRILYLNPQNLRYAVALRTSAIALSQ